jgi:hypothetical protein
MKDDNLHTNPADAEFDAHCRSLLQGRTVAAPDPQAAMFASETTAGSGRGLFYAGGAILLVAGAIWWAALPPDQDLPNALGSPVIESEVESTTPALEEQMLPASRLDDAVADEVPVPAAEPVVEKVESADSRGEVDVQERSLAASAPEPDETRGESETVDVPVVEPASTGMDAPPESETGGAALASPIEKAGPEVPDVAVPEEKTEPTEGKPRLTLPLTMPSGGGQR